MENQNQDRIVRKIDVASLTPAPLQLIQYAYLKATNDVVFGVVSDHASLHKFTRSIHHIEIDNSNTTHDDVCGLGTLRYCHTPLRMTINEKIVCWDPPLVYGYQIRNFQTILPNHLGLVLTEPINDGHTLLTWRTYFDGVMVGGQFAKVSLGIILPDLVSNIVKHFGGRIVTAKEAEALLPASNISI